MSDVPERGDLTWLIFTPQSGREQAGRRPALVLSPGRYHERSGRAVVCPITSNKQPRPWKVLLPDGLAVSGAVLVDQVRSIDRSARKLRTVGRAPQEILLDVQGKARSAPRHCGLIRPVMQGETGEGRFCADKAVALRAHSSPEMAQATAQAS